jgi:hypothetical protein
MTAMKRKRLIDEIDDPEIKEMLRQPVGTPLKLTREQALKIVHAGMGGRPDLPPGDEYVRRISRIWKGFLPRG